MVKWQLFHIWSKVVTVKAGTQERRMERRMECGKECGTEVMWFHTGNHTEMMQEVTINSNFPAATSCNSTAIFRRPSSLSLKNILHRSRDVFPLEPVNRFALRLTSRSETPSFSRWNESAWLCETTVHYYAYMHESCKVGIPTYISAKETWDLL